MDFFLLLPYFIDSPLTAIFMTSHRTWGFASWFISFVVFIVFLIKSTYSFSLRWLQFIFQKPFPLLVSNGMRSIRIKEWSDLNPGEMFDDLILPEIPNDTKKKSSLQKIGVGLFLCQEYTRLSGWWNLHISTNSVSSIQSFINAWDFALVVEFPPFLSISKFNTRLKSPPIILLSFGRDSNWCMTST